jgi:hypothetical protein
VITAKGHRWLWAMGIAGLVYLSTFIVLRYHLIPSHELTAFPEHHPLRPAYALIFYPLRLLAANNWSFVAPDPRTYVGKVDAVEDGTMGTVVFDYGDRSLSVGFVCVPSACADFKRVKPGQEVEAVFGVALVADRDGFVNKLLSIRSCGRGDQQCAINRERQRLEDQEMDSRMEASAKEFRNCIDAMEKTLQRDARYVPRVQDSAIDQTLLARFNALEGHQKACRESIVDSHRQAVFESCKLHKCGDRIGGGCWHIADPIHRGVIGRAVEKCGT